MYSRIVAAGVFSLFSFLLVSCRPQNNTIPIVVGGTTLHVEIAKTPAERQRGLMFRKSMSQNHGMLFIFPRDEELSFWMKNTEIPLSIAYISQGGTIKEIYHMEPHSLEAIQSNYAVRYALEVNQGEFARLGVKPGDHVTLPPNLPQATE